MKKKLSTIILVFIILVGFSLLLYPTVSDYWNSKVQSKAIAKYEDVVEQLDEEDYEQVLNNAREYNAKLADKDGDFKLTADENDDYYSQLSVTDDGLMSYIEIPSINVKLPVYHGTDDNELNVGVGHIPGSSLPVGGSSTHCVLLAHRGLPSARLFTDLDKVTVGDIFTITTLNEKLTYQVDQILITDPEDLSALGIVKGKDYCTLVTCTPYGVNTQRLLVRGHRIENIEESDILYVEAEAKQIKPIVVAPFAAIPIIIAMMVFLRNSSDEDEDDYDYRYDIDGNEHNERIDEENRKGG
jgi:sortase A